MLRSILMRVKLKFLCFVTFSVLIKPRWTWSNSSSSYVDRHWVNVKGRKRKFINYATVQFFFFAGKVIVALLIYFFILFLFNFFTLMMFLFLNINLRYERYAYAFAAWLVALNMVMIEMYAVIPFFV